MKQNYIFFKIPLNTLHNHSFPDQYIIRFIRIQKNIINTEIEAPFQITGITKTGISSFLLRNRKHT